VRGPIRLAALVGVVAVMLVPGAAEAADTVEQPTETPAGELALLTATTVQPSDLLPQFEIEPLNEGTTVKGTVTLDFCGGLFPSEELRVGRYQVVIRTATTAQSVASVEAVGYRDAAAAAQALDELSRARRACPKNIFVDSAVAGVLPAKWKFRPAPDKKWDDVAGVRRQAYNVRIAESQGDVTRGHLVYLQHGRFLIGMYGPPDNLEHIAALDLDGEAGLAAAMSDRLAQLPA
jgi:hypothetical protein